MASNKDRVKYIRRNEKYLLERDMLESLIWLSSLSRHLSEGLAPKIGNDAFRYLDELSERYKNFTNPTPEMQFRHWAINILREQAEKDYVTLERLVA